MLGIYTYLAILYLPADVVYEEVDAATVETAKHFTSFYGHKEQTTRNLRDYPMSFGDVA